MRTPGEIKQWLADKECSVWIKREKLAALEYIEQLEKKVADAEAAIEERDTIINLMKIQIAGDCGCCKHKDVPSVCADCMKKTGRPCWEYEGLPEVKSR